MTVDTSAEAQHWIGMAPDWAGSPSTEGEGGLRAFLRDGADLMAALLAERDAARAEVAQWKQAHGMLKVEIAKQRAAKRSHRQRAETAERKAAVAKARAALGDTDHG
jgi:hypothetical protein